MNHLKVFFSRRDSLAVGVAFVVMGFLFGNWATMIPYIKYKYDLSDSILGLVLLSMPIGCLASNYGAAVLVKKWGMRQMTVAGMILLSIAYSIAFMLHSLWIVVLGLVLAGICVSILNIAMNMTAAALEKSASVYIISTCHGMFSVGLMLGSFMLSITKPLGWSEPLHMLVMSGCTILAALLSYRTILNIKILSAIPSNEDERLKLTWPSGALLTMVVISLCTNMTEGSMADWATLYMSDIVKAVDSKIGWGLTSYSAFMALGRFGGDALIPKYGQNNILSWGALIVFVGFVLAIFAPYTYSTIVGFGLVGLGVSLGSPILYASAARYPDIPHSGGLAIMNTFSMAGFLAGPVLIGFISDVSNLSIALGFVGVLALLWFVKARNAVLY